MTTSSSSSSSRCQLAQTAKSGRWADRNRARPRRCNEVPADPGLCDGPGWRYVESLCCGNGDFFDAGRGDDPASWAWPVGGVFARRESYCLTYAFVPVTPGFMFSVAVGWPCSPAGPSTSCLSPWCRWRLLMHLLPSPLVISRGAAVAARVAYVLVWLPSPRTHLWRVPCFAAATQLFSGPWDSCCSDH